MVLYQQWAEEAKQSTHPGLCAENPMPQWVLGTLAMPFYSLKAAKSTKVCGPFDDADLASHILRMVLQNWQDQYQLSGALVPQSVRELLKVLECIEKAYPTKMVGEGPKAGAKSSNLSKKKMVSFSDRISKRPHTEKYCSLC